MANRTRVTIQSVRPPEVLVKEFRKAEEASLRAPAELWHESMLPEHFTVPGFKRYDYQLRVLGRKKGLREQLGYAGKEVHYKQGLGTVLREEPAGASLRELAMEIEDPQRRAKRLRWLERRGLADYVPHRLLGIPFRPLQRTGQLKRMATAGYRLKTMSRKRVNLVMDVPKHTYQYRKDGRDPDKVAELTRITDAEANDMARSYRDDLVKRLNNRGA